MEHVTFERTVPEGYREAYHMDATNKKTGTLLSVLSLVIAVPLIYLVIKTTDFSRFDFSSMLKYYLALLVLMVSYIILHELVHGAVYKMLTKEKLRFGLTWTVAFCGVPDIYTYRDTALKALVAPLTLFSVILLPLALWLRSVDPGWYMVAGVLFSLHLGGCIGDMYMTWMFLTKLREPSTLMRDTGPEQWIYVREEF